MEIKDKKLKKYSTANLVNSLIGTVCFVVAIVCVCLIKFFLIGNPVSTGVFFCLLIVSISVGVIVIGLFLFALTSRTYIISHTKYYVAFLTVIFISFAAHMFLSIVSPLLIAPGLTAVLIMPLSRQKNDAFVFNLIEAVLVFWALVLEQVLTEGDINMILGDSGTYLWLLMDVTVINIGAGAFVAAVLRDKTKKIYYLLSNALLTLSSIVVYMLLALAYEDTLSLIKYSWLLVVSGVVALIAYSVISPIIEIIFNLVTDSRLVEWTDSRRPLLSRLANEAPGTYNHSLAVANFAEMCAKAIGEDTYFARAAAYYHDVGKLINPSYFVENQSSGYNPHDKLLPELSADIIRSHAVEGYKILKSYGMPDEIARVAVEHHGTLPIRIFFERAKLLTDGEINADDYRYHGDIPTSKIAGIIMICDSCEAAIRAMNNPDGERVDALVRSIIRDRIDEGQFDRCPLSLFDLDVIRQTIGSAFGGVFHHRVQYPEGK